MNQQETLLGSIIVRPVNTCVFSLSGSVYAYNLYKKNFYIDTENNIPPIELKAAVQCRNGISIPDLNTNSQSIQGGEE